MTTSKQTGSLEGGLEAPIRSPVDWRNDDFHNTDLLNAELERVFDICHGCRRCVSLCDSFPTLFDLVDESPTFELDGVDKDDYSKVADQCYLCDLCFETKCPYVPPHPFNIDFPHLMLRAKSKKFAEQGAPLRDRLMASTDGINRLLTIPIVDITVNALTSSKLLRKALEVTVGVHSEAPLPQYYSNTARKRLADKLLDSGEAGSQKVTVTEKTRGRVAIYTSCYCNSSDPSIIEDLVKVLEHNAIETRIIAQEKCCGMPKLELGDLKAVDAIQAENIPHLAGIIEAGWDIISPIPSCVLMYKQEIPLLFPENTQAALVKQHIFDPFEYLWERHRQQLVNLEFPANAAQELRIFYQVACHQRVQNLGLKTRDVLQLIPNAQIKTIERCSGHDGSYAVRTETREKSVKIARPVIRQIKNEQPSNLTSDCPLALRQLAQLSDMEQIASHPISILRVAYGI
ncbi:MAG: (Fe-S)-binding protein [Gammaproteobacteria bacterium]